MKRILALLLIFMLLFTTSCGKDADNEVSHTTTIPSVESGVQEDPSSNPDSHNHDFMAVVTAPTCTSDGYTTYTCECGDSYVSDSVSATGHDYSSSTTAPTCTSDGYTTYTCACGDSYVSDKVATNGHQYSAVVTAPTCIAGGYTTYTCSCGDSYVSDNVAAKGHSYSTKVTAPTCTANGYTTYTCACGDSYVSNHVGAKGHSYSTKVTAPTCTAGGYTTYTCACGDSYVSDNVAAKGHSYSTKVTAPTCTAGGYTTYTCTCGYSYTGDTVAANGHTEETIPAVDATCTSTGLTEGKKCSICGVLTVAQTKVDAKGHSYTSKITSPTCTTSGYTTYTCTCGYSYTGNTVNATGHINTTTATKAATCIEPGYTKVTCACTYEVSNIVIPKLEHTFVEGKCSCGAEDSEYEPPHVHQYNATVTAPTCTANGYTTYTCSCGSSYTDDFVAAKGHAEETIPAVAATCTSSGLTAGKKCSTCGTVTVAQETVAAKGHSYTLKVTAPTCTADGYTTYTCTCGYSYTGDTVAANGHTEETIPAVDATCTSTGFTAGKKCSTCGTVTVAQETVATKSHSYTSKVTAPTCTTTGYTTHTCSSCGDTYTSDTVAANGHTEETIPAVDATCTSTGLTEGKKCSICGVVTVAQTNVDAKGHSYTSKITSPTCTTTGYTTHTCSSCGDTYTSDNVAANGHTPGAAATCTTAQTCTTCQVTIVIALGHNWVDATTEAPKTCTTCGATEGEKLPSTVTAPTLYVNYINVGQGDSILIKVDDCDILIDAGTSSYGSTVTNYLKNKGVDDIELMINTHPDADHCGGLTTVANNYTVEEVWISKDTSKTTAAYTNFIAAVSGERTPSVGEVYTYGHLTLTVLYASKGSDSNNSSIVVMLEYGSFKFLFMGDAGEEVENKLVSNGTDLSCDVLKVGHHGSKYSSTSSFLNATGAEYGVICVGSNTYGHPTSEALGRLDSAGITTYRTDNNGNVVFSTNGVTMQTPSGTVSEGSGSGLSGGASSGGSSSGSSSGSTSSTQYFIGNTESKVFHLPTCSNLPDSSKQNVMYNYYWIINIAGYTPCGRCLKNYSGGSTSTVMYILNTETKKYHLSTCSYLPAASKQQIIYSTYGYSPCGHCIK